ncbi:hypothetical protein FHP25_05235 [Vineibacter terrae]|uniref:Caspase family protein n=1 Tax=Vineibacter terrae TaxID=2586908 RepID=A0A5C8PTL8_9HYPH|nr:C13 family peptidase [Vineibacter terrae]TXL80432.1 hypothetical protein FHP25_05235 [Vineibacter terrae]
MMPSLVARCLAGALLVLTSACVQQQAPSASPAAAPVLSWKALLIGGDDAQPVFSNAVDTLQQRLAAFGVAAQDIAVLKSDAPPGEGVANRANVERQVHRLAGTAATGCFVFITAHGYPRGGLVLARSRIVIRPGDLDRLLERACGALPTVAIASGCFSGVYTDDATLRRPNRIVLAAARADLPSFGCSASERYTYYDRCFLDVLQQGAPWQAIAARVSQCVSGIERRSGDPPSHPQAFFGAAVARLAAF